ncbi:SRPBCC family protein [Nocardia pseudovaccinii]|uniref:SRPBCC family protein n=1 Tax=Nocardia pseudovaccinii TaxID=189540 RepID=UPI0007A38B03|nr:SRPBCC family protein [Nocardia pseudovaccinii]
MELLNTFAVDCPLDRAWDVLTDAGRVIPCLPGAVLVSVNGDEFEGAIKIKLGPVSLQYAGIGRFLERDADSWTVVIRGEGKDVRGQGNVAVTITLTLSEQGAGTEGRVRTDFALSGRAAQFGRGVIADVTNKVLDQFVRNLEAEVSGSGAERPSVSARSGAIDDVEPLNVMDTMNGVVAKYLLPVVGAGIAVAASVLLVRLLTRTVQPNRTYGVPRACGPEVSLAIPHVIVTFSSGVPA